MPVPDFQTLMLPILQLASDGQEHKLKETVTRMADHFNLSEDERNELLASSRQTRLYSNVSWAITYLRAAGILVSPARGVFRITQRGREALSQNPSRIDIQYLRRYPEFVEFQMRISDKRNAQSSAQVETVESLTPNDQLENAYRALRQALAQDLLERVKNSSPRFFEELVVDLLVAMGYGGSVEDAGKALGKSGDEGIDGLIKSDVLGLDQVYIQAKRWNDMVGRPTVQAFAGSLDGVRAKRGVLITTSRFSKDAQDYVERIDKKIVLIDGERLVQLMIDYNVGVTEERRYVIKRVDNDYFEEG